VVLNYLSAGDTPYKEKVNPLGQKINPHDPRIEAMGKSFFNQPGHCQKAAIERIDLQSLFPSTEDNPQGVSAPPGSTDGGSSGGGSEGMPVNPTTTSKPTGHGGSRSINPSQMPSADGCSYDSDGRPNCAVQIEVDFWDKDKISAEFGGDVKIIGKVDDDMLDFVKPLLEKAVNRPSCKAFIEQFAGGADIGALFGKVRKQGGFVYIERKAGDKDVAFQTGSIEQKTAQIQYNYRLPFPSEPGKKYTELGFFIATRMLVITLIHELIHASNDKLHDYEMGRRLFEAGKIKENPNVNIKGMTKEEARKATFNASDKWSNVLRSECTPSDQEFLDWWKNWGLDE